MPETWKGRWDAANNIYSLNYKVRIDAGGNCERYIISSLPPSGKDTTRKEKAWDHNAEYINNSQYFADNQFIDKDIAQARQAMLWASVSVTFNFMNASLAQEVSRHLKPFFILNQFGTRQTKGLGVFLPHDISEMEIEDILRREQRILGFYKFGNPGTIQKKLGLINDKYSLLKRGKSWGGYQKSKLWEYACSNGSISWEKRKIKKHMIANDSNLFNSLKHNGGTHHMDGCSEAVDNGAENFKYLRVLLGMSDNMEFMKSNNQRLQVKVADVKGEVSRVRSPIQFLVTEGVTYVIVHPVNPLVWRTLDGESRRYRFTIGEIKSNKSFELEAPDNFNIIACLNSSGLFGNNLKG